jgi:hypothetical protein
MLRAHTARTIHIGVNFVLAPPPDLALYLDFQKRLAEEKIGFDQVNKTETQIVFIRQQAARLQVQLGGGIGPQQQLGQLLIVAATDPQSSAVEAGISRDQFVVEAEIICDIFREVWPERGQTVSRDSAVQMLLDSGADHAFQFLWEERLGQPQGSLGVFERPVLGGGLRLVMPAQPELEDPNMLEVKVESFLRNPRLVYVDATIRWPKPQPAELSPAALVDAAIEFIENRVIPFIKMGQETK